MYRGFFAKRSSGGEWREASGECININLAGFGDLVVDQLKYGCFSQPHSDWLPFRNLRTFLRALPHSPFVKLRTGGRGTSYKLSAI